MDAVGLVGQGYVSLDDVRLQEVQARRVDCLALE